MFLILFVQTTILSLAGGYDALYCVVANESVRPRVLALWDAYAARHHIQILSLDVSIDDHGLRIRPS